MNRKQIVVLLAISVMLSACSDDTNTNLQAGSVPVAVVSSDTTIQKAYGGCTRDMARELTLDNPGTEKDIMQLMLQPIPGLCLGAVVKPCEKDRNGFLCKTMIDEYKNK